MTKKFYMPLLALAVLALCSCSSKMGALSPDYFTCTPQVLEAVGGQVPVTINGKFPVKYFKKNATVQVTPVLRWNGGEAKSTPAYFQGEKVEGNNQTISYKMGGNYTMKANFKYVPDMAKSELYLTFDAKSGSKTITIPDVKVADGVISTSELVNNTLSSSNMAMGRDNFVRITNDTLNEQIMFLIQQANIRANQMKATKSFNKKVAAYSKDENKKVENVEVSSYASPDGGVNLNTTLSKKREANTTKLINKQLKGSKLNTSVDSKYTAQDWEGFKELVSKSDMQDKDLILRVLSMYQDPAQRETEIRNISTVYSKLAKDVLPQLRRSRLSLNYQNIGKSDEEIASLANDDPSKLNVEELLYSATLTNDKAKKEAIYTKATEQYPNDYRAYNNLGNLAYTVGDVDKAQSYFSKAASLKEAPEVDNNLGLVALLKGNKTEAENYLSKATAAPESNEALGNLYIAQGQYDKAVSAFGDTKTNSAALAQILTKDYNKAKTTLSNVTNPDAYTNYLMAVLGARTDNSSMVVESLKSAISKDSSLAKKAANDLEFAKYFTDSSFKNVVK
jgi:tetratricopeptide (TPR) repeat protein